MSCKRYGSSKTVTKKTKKSNGQTQEYCQKKRKTLKFNHAAPKFLRLQITYLGLAHKCLGSILEHQQFHLGDMGVLSL